MITPFDDIELVSREQALALCRLRRHWLCEGRWLVAERYDDRYDTEVGGTHFVATQSIDQLLGRSDESTIAAPLTALNDPTIVDYGDGGRAISIGEAESRPELSGVLARLRERVAAYHAHMTDKH